MPSVSLSSSFSACSQLSEFSKGLTHNKAKICRPNNITAAVQLVIMTLNSGTVQSSWWMDAGYLTSWLHNVMKLLCTNKKTKHFNPHICKYKFQHYTLFNILWLFFTYALNYRLFCKIKHSQLDSTFTVLCQNVGWLVISEAHQSLIRNCTVEISYIIATINLASYNKSSSVCVDTIKS